jgi:mannose-1-phosphate guanylyltransferase/phosphomannomutase
MTKIIIVAGGLATRMLPITEQIPKCLVDINGKPLIQHQLEFFKSKGYTDFIFCVAHLAEKVKEYFGDGSKFGISIQYVQETKELMGTAGSVKLAESLITEPEFIVYYGDNLTSMNIDKFLRFHRLKHSLATVALRPSPPGYKASSIILLHPDNRIKLFLEKPTAVDYDKYCEEQMYINSGIYIFGREIFSLIPKNTKFDFARELFPRLLSYHDPFFGYPTTEFFREIGRVEKYEAFLLEVKGREDIFNAADKKKAVFLDRDGVINQNGPKIDSPEKFVMLDGAPDAIKRLNDSGYLVIVATNQPDIAKGFYTFIELEKIHKKMGQLLGEKGAHIDAIYVCPHHPEKGFPGEVPELKIECGCRKPEPGMILQAITDLSIDPKQSWMVGDSKADIIAGQKAGLKTIFITSGGGSTSRQEKELECRPDFEKRDLSEAVGLILSK